MSGLSRIATVEQTSRFGSFVPTAEVMLTVVEPSRWQGSSLYRSLRKLTGGRDSLAHALQWMLMLACQVKYLCHLRVSDVVGIDTARTDTLIMDLKHDPS